MNVRRNDKIHFVADAYNQFDQLIFAEKRKTHTSV